MPTPNDGSSFQKNFSMSPLLATSQPLNGNGVSANGASRPSGASVEEEMPNGWQDTTVQCKNRILAALPQDVRERLMPQMRRVLLHQSDVLQESGMAVEHVYFIETGMISMVVDAQDGAQVEAAVTGPEGIVGVTSVLGNQPSFHRMVVQIPGNAYRMPASALQRECRENPQFQELLHRHLYLLVAQASQGTLCNRIHTVEERLSRWLLTVSDRIQSDDLELTHEFIAHMLGVRRAGVTVALGMLQQSGMIDATRGRIRLVDRENLQCCACECFEVLRQQFAMLEANASSRE